MLSLSVEVCLIDGASEIGTKATDSSRFPACGGKIGSPGGVGAGKIASSTEPTCSAVISYYGALAPVGTGECICEGYESRYETCDLGASLCVSSAHG